MEGVVRAPSAFSITRAWLPSMMATQEFVVPRSIPMTLAMSLKSLSSGGFERSGPRVAPVAGMVCGGPAVGLPIWRIYRQGSEGLQRPGPHLMFAKVSRPGRGERMTQDPTLTVRDVAIHGGFLPPEAQRAMVADLRGKSCGRRRCSAP